MAHVWTYLHRADDTVIASTSCEWSPGAKWEWIANHYAIDNDCRPEEISIDETDEGEVITAMGEPVGYVVNELRGASIKQYAEAAE